MSGRDRIAGEAEKTLIPNFAPVKKKLAGVKLNNANLWWTRGNVDDKIEALEPDVGSVAQSGG